jgi:FdhE protein
METLLASQPETAPWLGVLSAVLEEAAEPAWDAVAALTTLAAPETARRPDGQTASGAIRSGRLTVSPSGRLHSPGTPLLAGARIPVDARLADRWVRRVLALAAETSRESEVGSREVPDRLTDFPADRLRAMGDAALDARALLEAAINADGDRLEAFARSLEIDPDALAAVAALAAMPLLQALRRRFGPAVDPRWDEGWCPICGGWPHLAEQRGLERARRLRCARCGGDWAQPGIRCPYCGVVGHEARAALVSEQDGEARKIETCAACRGYLKSVSTLRACSGEEVALTDLATVDLDLVALEREYERPQPRRLEPGVTVIV